MRTLILTGLIILTFANVTQANETKQSASVDLTALQGNYTESVVHQFYLSNYIGVKRLADNYVALQGVIEAQAMRQAEIDCNTYMIDETFSKSDWPSIFHFIERVLRNSSVELFATKTGIFEQYLVHKESSSM